MVTQAVTVWCNAKVLMLFSCLKVLKHTKIIFVLKTACHLVLSMYMKKGNHLKLTV